MSTQNIIFSLTKIEKLIIELNESIDKVSCCYEAPIVWVDHDNKTLLSNNDVQENIYIFHRLLIKALSDSLTLHDSITKDIGYLYNEYCESLWNDTYQTKESFSYTKLENRNHWIGNNYNLWSSHSLTSWLYNDSSGSIIFEVTPVYPGGFGDKTKTTSNISYNQWIKTYKTYLIKVIPKKVAESWLTLSIKVLNQLEKNSQ